MEGVGALDLIGVGTWLVGATRELLATSRQLLVVATVQACCFCGGCPIHPLEQAPFQDLRDLVVGSRLNDAAPSGEASDNRLNLLEGLLALPPLIQQPL